MGILRIVGGERRGFHLRSPSGGDLRPTSNRVREALFDLLGERVRESRFLDLFAGTGAVGIEALSRGARMSVFVERDRAALSLIRRNLEICEFSPRARVVAGSLPGALRRLERGRAFDLIFIDPPYGHSDGSRVLDVLHPQELLRGNCLVIFEHDRHWEIPLRIGSLRHHRSVRYGDTLLSFFEPLAGGGTPASRFDRTGDRPI